MFYKEIEVLLAPKTENNIHPSFMEAGEQRAGPPLPLASFLLHVALSSLRGKSLLCSLPPAWLYIMNFHSPLPVPRPLSPDFKPPVGKHGPDHCSGKSLQGAGH